MQKNTNVVFSFYYSSYSFFFNIYLLGEKSVSVIQLSWEWNKCLLVYLYAKCTLK